MMKFRRTGIAQARRLTEPRTWLTDHGDEMRAEAGDWWVRTRHGGETVERSVKPDAFSATYEHLEDDRYRRKGVVEARQVSTAETVSTDEGDALAAPGDWIITDERGDTWPVPGGKFWTLYEREPAVGGAGEAGGCEADPST